MAPNLGSLLGNGLGRAGNGGLALLLVSKTTSLVVNGSNLFLELGGNTGDLLARGGLKSLFFVQKIETRLEKRFGTMLFRKPDHFDKKTSRVAMDIDSTSHTHTHTHTHIPGCCNRDPVQRRH